MYYTYYLLTTYMYFFFKGIKNPPEKARKEQNVEGKATNSTIKNGS